MVPLQAYNRHIISEHLKEPEDYVIVLVNRLASAVRQQKNTMISIDSIGHVLF